jgi:hypothetical protein
MMREGSLGRRMFEVFGLLSLAHFLVVGGGLAFLLGTGRLDGAKLEQIGAVMRGEVVAPPEEADAEAGTEQDSTATRAKGESTGDTAKLPSGSVDVTALNQMRAEIDRRESERIKAELDQRLATVNRILLQVTAKKKAFEREVEDQAQRQAEVEVVKENVGFQKELEYFESLSPKVAVKHLLSKDPEEAARVLLALDTRKGKKIIEAAKDGADLATMKIVLQRLKEVAPTRSAELETE